MLHRVYQQNPIQKINAIATPNNGGYICSTSGYSTMSFVFRVIKRQKAGKNKDDASTSIKFEYNYSSEGLIQVILRIDLNKVTAIREVFPNLDASITIRTFPKHVLGFSTDWSVKKIQWFSPLPKPKQKEEEKYHNQQLPRFERKNCETNTMFLIEQQQFFRAAPSSSVVASSVTPTKEAIVYEIYGMVQYWQMAAYCSGIIIVIYSSSNSNSNSNSKSNNHWRRNSSKTEDYCYYYYHSRTGSDAMIWYQQQQQKEDPLLCVFINNLI